MGDPLEGLYAVRRIDAVRAGSVLKEAFARDPLWQAVFALESGGESKRQAFFEVPVLFGLRYGRVYAPSPALEGVAVWLPGERAGMGLWRMMRSGALRPGLRLGPSLGRKLQQVLGGTIRDRERHMRGRLYLYLMVLGVAPAHQRRGLGGRLLRALIQEGEREGRALYLETETEENVALYQKYGFRVLKSPRLPVVDLPFWEMARPPGGADEVSDGPGRA
jgi:ribosomal protein S18 acetylase RimI-like enzyme